MRRATVVRAFLRGEEELRPGQQFDCDANEYAKWLALGFVAGYETKVDVAKKKPAPSASLPAGQASRKKTPKRSKRSAARSSS